VTNIDKQVGMNTQAIGGLHEKVDEFRSEIREHRKVDRENRIMEKDKVKKENDKRDKRIDWTFYLVIIGAATGILDLATQAGPVSQLLAFLTP